MSKKIFLDFDEVIADTTSAIAYYYNQNFKNKDGFKKAVGSKIMTWGFEDQCPLMTKEDKAAMWEDETFFVNLKPMKDFEKYLRLLSENFSISVVTIGILGNIKHKTTWFDNHPEIKKHISSYLFISDSTMKMDKSVVNMSDGIFLDDSTKNLISSNAPFRYVFGRQTGWNSDAEDIGIERFSNWEDAYLKINKTFEKE